MNGKKYCCERSRDGDAVMQKSAVSQGGRVARVN